MTRTIVLLVSSALISACNGVSQQRGVDDQTLVTWQPKILADEDDIGYCAQAPVPIYIDGINGTRALLKILGSTSVEANRSITSASVGAGLMLALFSGSVEERGAVGTYTYTQLTRYTSAWLDGISEDFGDVELLVGVTAAMKVDVVWADAAVTVTSFPTLAAAIESGKVKGRYAIHIPAQVGGRLASALGPQPYGELTVESFRAALDYLNRYAAVFAKATYDQGDLEFQPAVFAIKAPGKESTKPCTKAREVANLVAKSGWVFRPQPALRGTNAPDQLQTTVFMAKDWRNGLFPGDFGDMVLDGDTLKPAIPSSGTDQVWFGFSPNPRSRYEFEFEWALTQDVSIDMISGRMSNGACPRDQRLQQVRVPQSSGVFTRYVFPISELPSDTTCMRFKLARDSQGRMPAIKKVTVVER